MTWKGRCGGAAGAFVLSAMVSSVWSVSRQGRDGELGPVATLSRRGCLSSLDKQGNILVCKLINHKDTLDCLSLAYARQCQSGVQNIRRVPGPVTASRCYPRTETPGSETVSVAGIVYIPCSTPAASPGGAVDACSHRIQETPIVHLARVAVPYTVQYRSVGILIFLAPDIRLSQCCNDGELSILTIDDGPTLFKQWDHRPGRARRPRSAAGVCGQQQGWCAGEHERRRECGRDYDRRRGCKGAVDMGAVCVSRLLRALRCENRGRERAGIWHWKRHLQMLMERATVCAQPTSHPVALFFLLAFRTAAIVTYLLCGFFSNSCTCALHTMRRIPTNGNC